MKIFTLLIQTYEKKFTTEEIKYSRFCIMRCYESDCIFLIHCLVGIYETNYCAHAISETKLTK